MRKSLLETMVCMTERLAVALIATVTLLGCATQSGPTMASLATIAPPPAGKARIIVMRPEKGFFGWGDRALPVKIDGEPMGDLMTGEYVSRDRPPGRHQLSVDLWDLPGVSRHDFNAAPGRTYYFAARVKQKANDIHAATIFGGLVGRTIVAAATDDNTGAVDLIPISEAEARRAIAEIR